MTESIEIAARVVIVSPDPKCRGCKLITVGDEAWGYVLVHGHGGGGNTFTFEDSSYQEIGTISAGGHFRRIVVRGDKMEKRSQPIGAVIAPVADRILATVRELICNGKLKSPATLKIEFEAELEAKRLRQLEAKAAELAEFRAKADEIANTLPSSCSPKYVLSTSDKIIEAMRWAQTK